MLKELEVKSQLTDRVLIASNREIILILRRFVRCFQIVQFVPSFDRNVALEILEAKALQFRRADLQASQCGVHVELPHAKLEKIDLLGQKIEIELFERLVIADGKLFPDSICQIIALINWIIASDVSLLLFAVSEDQLL